MNLFWTWWATPPTPQRPPECWGFKGTARHIKGKVFVRGGTVYMTVTNLRTGKVLASDNVALHTIYGRGTGLPHIFKACQEAVSAARGAWTYDFRRGELK